MIVWYLSVFLPVMAGLWSIFVAKTGKLNPMKPVASRAARMGILGMWVPDRQAVAQGKAELFSASMELAVPHPDPPVYELYDHPAPPIPLLGASLPQAPIGYGWEIHVVPNEADNPALRLAMLDLKTSTVIDAIEADLVILRRWKYAADDTYPAFYRRAEAQARKEIVGHKTHGSGSYRHTTPIYNDDPSKMLGKVMMANLITPMVDWARLITLRYIVDHPDETKCNYMLIENMEEAMG